MSMLLHKCLHFAIMFAGKRVFIMKNANSVTQDKKAIFLERFKELVGNTATQTEIAEKIGHNISRASVGYWLKGTMPNSQSLQWIANAYNVSVNWLIGDTDVKAANPNVETVCAYTGLSEAALNSLVQQMNNDHLGLNNKGTSFKECINLFFTNPHFEMFIIALLRYFNSIKELENPQQMFSQELKKENIPITNIKKQAADISYKAITELKDIGTKKVEYASKLVGLYEKAETEEYRVQRSMTKILSYYKKEGE